MAIAMVSESLIDYRARVIDCIDERGFRDALDSGPQIRHLGQWLVWVDLAATPADLHCLQEQGHELIDLLAVARRAGLPW